MISPIPRFFGSSNSLDYVNHWRSPHAEPPSHGDRKSCLTQHKICPPGHIQRFPVWRPNSSPGARSRAADAIVYGHPFSQMGITFCSVIRIAYKTPIRNRHSETPNAPLLPQAIRRHFGVKKPSFRSLKLQFLPTISPIQSRPLTAIGSHVQLDARSAPRSWIWVPEHHRYSHPLRFIPTPSAKELGIIFRTGIGIAYVTTIRNRHSETVDRALVSQNSALESKFPSGACVLVHRLSNPLVGRDNLFARGSEPPARPQFRIGTSTRPVKGRIRRFPVQRPNSSPGARLWAADAIAYRHPFAQTGITFRSTSFRPTISPIRRFFGRSDSLDYANRCRSPNAEPPSHGDRKSCSTRCEISSPGRGYGCSNIADIVTPSGLFPPLQ
ncbi:hypothetical protein Taro_022895 [Colocasia esculenta]|uniref:Uncharacterized protein n=1 Tax=Colocasia esculenta TaxID=4460 RepID=A0A843VFR9_COLES|nr:hypothetical protein [Colocasia esculenta]